MPGATPFLGGARWREIEAWMTEHDVSVDHIAIVDDGYDMGVDSFASAHSLDSMRRLREP